MNTPRHLHFLGIAGYTMYGVARAVRQLGYKVTGTDETAYPPVTDWLDRAGITWWRQGDPKHLEGVTTMIVSGGTAADHLEVLEAQRRGIAVISYAELVGQILADDECLVVTGTHGKTTTTSLLAWILEVAGKRPDFLVGIQPHNFDSTVRLAGSGVAVLEGDDYLSSKLDDRPKFMHYQPDRLILTSVEMDHPDFFKDLDDVIVKFQRLVKGMPGQGKLYYALGLPTVSRVVSAASCDRYSYGLDEGDWQARNLRLTPKGLELDVVHGTETVAGLTIGLYGRHNALNTVAAVAMALDYGVAVAKVREALRSFKGAARRFESVSQPGAVVTVIDDYAHHPTEVAATIAAAKDHFPNSRLIAVFQPHTYSRTAVLLSEFQQSFARADLALVAPIEAAREFAADSPVKGEDIVKGAPGNVHYEPDRVKLISRVQAAARPGDVVLCMSVNGFQGIATEIDQTLNKRSKAGADGA